MKVFSGNTMHGVFDALLPQFERRNGCTVDVSYDPAQIVLKRVEAGESGDLALLGETVLDELIRRGSIDAATRRPIARCGVGIAVRAGAPKPDLATMEKLKRALLEARSIAVTTSGASGIHFWKLVERLGIADAVKAKSVTRPGGLIAEFVVSGEADIAFQQIPELRAVPGVDLAGPLPREAQHITTSAAGVFVGSREREDAVALIEFLRTPDAAEVFTAKGLEPVR